MFENAYTLFDLFIFLLIGFLLGSGLISFLFWKFLRSRLNIRIFFEQVMENQYDDLRYRGESPIARQGEDVPYLG